MTEALSDDRQANQISLLKMQFITMSGKFWLAFVVTIIGGTILSVVEVDAQSTVDDSASCTLYDETVNLIKEEFKNVKSLLGSNQRQHDNKSSTSISKQDLEELKASIQQLSRPQDLSAHDTISSLLCDYRTFSL